MFSRFLRPCCLLVLSLFVVPAAAGAQDTTGVGAITGTVVTAPGEPALAVTVCLVGTIRCTATDDRGRFRLDDIRPGRYVLELAPPGRPRIVGAMVDVRAGLDTVVEVTLPALAAIEQTVTVTASAFVAPEEVKTSGFLVQPAEIAKSAGALQDVSRYLQTLPGVAIGTDDFRNDIIVRGGSPLENLFIVDNIEIPNINAFANFASAGGTVSVLDTALIRDVTFLTGGYPAPYINRVSSVLQITQREGDRERVAGRATFGFAGAGGVIEGPINKGHGSWIVSARRSVLDFFTKDIGVGGVPVLYTLNAKAVYDLTPRDRIWVVNVSGVDRIRLGLTATTDLTSELSAFDIRYQGWRSATGANWQHIFGARGVGLLGVTYSRASVTSTVKDLLQGGVPPADTPVDTVIANGPVVFRDDSRESETTTKYDLTMAMGGLGKLQAGGSVKIFHLDYAAASPIGNDSPFSLTPSVNAFSLTRAFPAYQTGGYVQATRDVGRRVNLTIGGRFDDYRFGGDRRFSPRAGASVAVSPRLSWRASYGRYYQQPFFLFLAAFPQNAALVPLRADHVVTGLSYELSRRTRVTVEAYRKTYRDYPVSTGFPSLSLANVGDTFNVRDVLFPMTSAGRGRAQGLEFLAERKSGGRWYGQVNLAVSRARHAGLDGVLRPGSFDYPVVFNLDGGYQIAERWQASARLAYLSGRPYTPFDVAASTAQDRGVFDLARVNGARLPDYVRFDVRAERALRPSRSLIIFAGAQNVTNRRNVASYSWDRRRNRSRVQQQMGVFPIFGLEWRF